MHLGRRSRSGLTTPTKGGFPASRAVSAPGLFAEIKQVRGLTEIIHESGRILRRLLHTSPTRKRVNFAAFTRLRFGLVCDHE